MRLGLTITVFLAVALAAAPGTAVRAQSAFDQLQEACRQSGGNCSPNIPSVPEPTRVDQDHSRTTKAPQAARPAPRPPTLSPEQAMKVQVTGMLLEGLFASIMNDGKAEAESAAAAAARQQAEAALLQQRAAHVQQQRSSREAENGRSLEELSAALSDPWVGRPAPPSGSDPVRVGGSGVVGLFDPPSNPFARPPARPSASAVASERLARLAAENADVAVLAGRLAELEDRLAAVRAEAVGLKRDMKGASRELDWWGEKVAAAASDAKERGVSMALDGLLTLEPKALARLGEVQSNSRAWNRMTDLLRTGDSAAHGIIDASSMVGDRLDDAKRLVAQRDFKEDVTYLAQRLGGKYGALGVSIVSSAQNIRDELQGWKAIDKGNAEVALGPARLARIQADYAALAGDLKKARVAVSSATGIPAKDLVRGAPEPDLPSSIGSHVPHPND